MSSTADVFTRLTSAIGAKHVVSAAEEVEGYAVDGLLPGAIARPGSVDQVLEVVRFAHAEKLAILPVGSRSKSELGSPLERYDIALDMTGLREIVHYDPGDLTLSVDAGAPLRELETRLRQHGQFLPLAVPCFESTTAAGTIASGIDSALRLLYGSARDFVIGAEFIDGTANLCRSGGRVVKNVTGYDLHKLLIGSLGTLGVITRVNFRTFPLPTVSGGYLIGFAKPQEALEFRKSVEKAGLPLANLEILHPQISGIMRAILQRSQEACPPELTKEAWCVYSSFQGSEEVVRRIHADLLKLAEEKHSVYHRRLELAEDQAVGGMLRECFEWLRWASPCNIVCRIALPEITDKILAELSASAEAVGLPRGLLIRAAGILYFAVLAETENDAATAALEKVAAQAKSIARAHNGYASLLHANLAVKRRMAGAGLSQAEPAMQLRIRCAFDPFALFAPGRVPGGI